IVLYVWRQSRDEQGTLLESSDILASVAPLTTAPIYGMTMPLIGGGIVGGYINTADESGTRAAEIALRIADGARPQDIEIKNAPSVPVFDWRQLKRWHLSENDLPAESVLRFKEETFWQQYKGRILIGISIIVLQAALIAGLLIERRRRWRVT